MFGTSPDKKFLKAAAAGDMATLNGFLDAASRSFSLDVRGPMGRTALIEAAAGGRLEAVKKLIEKGAGLEVADDNGRTPLIAAALAGQTAVVKVLVAAKADVNAHDNDFATALHAAAENGDLESVKALAGAKAGLDAVTKSYMRTPLHNALESKRGLVAEFLIQQGARTDIKDWNGRPAAYTAKKDARLLQLMEEARQKPAPAPLIEAPLPATPLSEETGETGDGWILLDKRRVAHVGNYPALNRKITEIFNFEARERMTIAENLKTGIETFAPAEKFSALTDEAVGAATEALKRLGGVKDGKSFTL